MVVRLLRPLLAILVAVALAGTLAAQAASTVSCDSMQMIATVHEAPSGQARVPCKGMTLGCVDALGCVSTSSLPAPAISASGPLIWTHVVYWAATDVREGLSVKPALDPPIPFA